MSSIARCASGVCAVNGWCAASGVSAASGVRVPCEAVVLAEWRERVPGCATSLRQRRLHEMRHDARHNAGVAMRVHGIGTRTESPRDAKFDDGPGGSDGILSAF